PAPRPAPRAFGSLGQLLSNAHIGLPSDGRFQNSNYDDRLHVESFADPYIGAAVGGDGLVGGTLRASFGVTFGDMLRDRQLQALIRGGQTRDETRRRIG